MSPYLSHAKMAYTIAEVGNLLSLSRAAVYRLIDAGLIETIKVGKARRVTSRQLEAFLLAKEAEQGAGPSFADLVARPRFRSRTS